MKLTPKQAYAIMRLSEWFRVEPEKLIHAMLDYQLDYLEKVKSMSAVEQQLIKKYKLAQRFKLLD